MTHLLTSPISVALNLTAQEVIAEINDSRTESVALFSSLDPIQGEALAVDAWRIGLHALANAHAQANEARLADVGKSLMESLDDQLKRFVEGQRETLASLLGKYFDPKDGHVSTRLAEFVSDEGTLARFLSGFLGPQNSILAEALSRQVGESSPLFRKLSPTDNEGVVKQLEGQIREVLQDGRAELVNALDPLAQDGAVAKFLRQLRAELKNAGEDSSEQLAVALRALDANNEDSLLSRLIRETERARAELTLAMNPSVPGSPMAVLKVSIEQLLQRHLEVGEAAFKAQRERQESFEKEVREVLGRIETKRSTALSTPQGGRGFEENVAAVINSTLRGAPCIVERCGNTVGVLPRCKTGDCVVRFTAESAYSGAATVFEAKQDASYTVTDALAELERARKNRNSSSGVFVMARSHATEAFPTFGRYGNDVLVTWDPEDASSLPYLQAAVLLGVALVARVRTIADQGDIEALREAEARLLTEVERMGKMEKSVETIRRCAESLSEELRKGQKAVTLVVRDTQATLRALNAEVMDEAVERNSPIALLPAREEPFGGERGLLLSNPVAP
jgi:hypothetical protein